MAGSSGKVVLLPDSCRFGSSAKVVLLPDSCRLGSFAKRVLLPESRELSPSMKILLTQSRMSGFSRSSGKLVLLTTELAQVGVSPTRRRQTISPFIVLCVVYFLYCQGCLTTHIDKTRLQGENCISGLNIKWLHDLCMFGFGKNSIHACHSSEAVVLSPASECVYYYRIT